MLPAVAGLPMNIGNSIALVSLTLFTGALPANALDPNVRISQYAHTAWRMQDGVFNAAPNVVTQTTDGYIWIGTGSGLVKFDGVRFVPWNPPPGKRLLNSAVYSLRSASDGTLWIGTGMGLARWKNNDVLNFPLGRINEILEDRQGRIWLGRSRPPDPRGGLCQVVDQEESRCFGNSPNMNLFYAGPMAQDKEGSLWVGGSNELMRWSPESFKIYYREQLNSPEALASVQSIAASDDGSVWVAVSKKGIGLQQLIGGIPHKVEFPGLDTSRVSVVFIDRNRSLWIGTFDDGIYRVCGERVDHFRSEDGLSSNTVSRFFEDREGGLWLVTSKGLDHFRDNRVVTFSVREGLTTDLASSVLAARDGDIWIGNHEALDLLRDGHITSIRQPKLPGKRVTSLYEDHLGRLWVGVDDKLTIYEHGQFRKINRPDGLNLGTVIAIAEDRDHDIWASVVGKERLLFRIRDMRVRAQLGATQIPSARVIAADPTGGVWLGLTNGNLGHYRDGKLETFTLPQETPPSAVAGLIVDADGSVLAATRSGLVRWKARQMRMLSSRNGLPCEAIATAVRDDRATIWLYTGCGLIAIRDSEIERWWQNPETFVQTRLLDAFDGVQAAQSSFQPSVSKSLDGRLWFANDAVVQMINPTEARENHISPPVYIEQVRADHRDYSIQGNLRFPPRTRDIEIHYTAPSFLIPQKVRFRYKLDGRDLEWQDAGTRRQVFYSDLGPGQYRFHVTAANNDGVWNELGTALDLSLDAAYYQTLWFRLLCSGFAVAGLAALYRLRVRQIAAEMNSRFDERVAERVRLARDFHDTLLQTIQGSKMVADDALERSADPAVVRSALVRLSAWLGQAIDEGRSALSSLRASTTQRNDLAEALKRAGEECRFQRSIAFELSVDGSGVDMHPIVRDEVYRIGYEAIQNACVHSGASRLTVEINYKGNLVLRIRDDGKGIDPEVAAKGKTGHFGLIGMHERASRIRGKLTISGSPGNGTIVELVVPENIVSQK